MRASGRRPITLKGVGLVLMLLLAPAALRSQDMDTWRRAFSERLDETIASLRNEAQNRATPPVLVKWGGASQAEIPPGLLPPAGFAPPARLSAVAGILREKGLPPSLMGVAAVESGFNPLALSPKGARGLWQLMPETAQRYGLVVDSLRDERADPLKSTQAAAQYLKDLFAQFGDWPLALAAYNAGERRVAQAIERVGTRDFWTLRRQAALPNETLRYVPAVMAKLQIAPLSLDLPSIPSVGKEAGVRGRVVYAWPAAQPAVSQGGRDATANSMAAKLGSRL